MRLIVLLGVPGAGKGTQAARIGQSLGLPHVSSGDLFRENFKNNTDLGHEAQKYLAKGELVPDEVTVEMVKQRLAAPDGVAGAILDGFPRTEPQAEALDQLAGGRIEAAVHIEVPLERLVERMSGRRVCREVGHVYHVLYKPPRVDGICDVDGSELYQREDDLPETVRHRIEVYEEQTEPLIDFYRERGVLKVVDGDQPLDSVTADILTVLGAETSQ